MKDLGIAASPGRHLVRVLWPLPDLGKGPHTLTLADDGIQPSPRPSSAIAKVLSEGRDALYVAGKGRDALAIAGEGIE